MASLDEHTASSSAKIICIGGNGSGKTGSLVSLAEAGFNVRILDLDKGAEIIGQLAKGEARKRFDIESFSDDYIIKKTGAVERMVPVLPLRGFKGAMQCLQDWPKFGSPSTWTTKDILVVDSLTNLGKYIMNHVMVSKNKHISADPKDHHPSQPDWGDAMNIQENFCAQLYSDSIKCHVIVMAHVTYVQNEGDSMQKGYPSALGSKLPPKIGSYFNHTLHYTSKGVGASAQRGFSTKSTAFIETKTPNPNAVKDWYPVDTGLAEYFKAMGYEPK